MSNRRQALVTGGGRGIGRGIVLALAAEGWHVAINFRSNREAAEEAAAGARDAGGEATLVPGNIADPASRAEVAAATLDACGTLDLLVNNAGMAPRQRMDLLEMGEASYDEVMDVNLKGPLFLTQTLARHMVDRVDSGGSPGQIVNIGSISGFTSSTNRSEYCISKAGMTMMTALLADCLSPWGINVYEIQPGMIETDMTRGVKARYDALIDDGLTPIPRWGQPEDIGKAVAAIAGGALPFSTGEVIRVDGGFHMHRL
ncbi:MAG: 3-ketoacyl-ACP reductase [Caldilineaceae bacterium SB0665_bin_21]|nr:3-ketoacyl-ACP reductase [Caldilineaceae bacterium SB0665_bin_21]MYA03170.1 3-ketoacyl-ACP reductase [Caldilineaceae bacterium SB0664_bin_22]MYC61460.1 3-ketoacyl-ACP reductase [Caldilineaceae bacterium SB0661_bin_34]